MRSVAVNGNTMTLRGADGDTVTVTGIDGTVRFTGKIESTGSISTELPQGVYVATIGKSIHKAIIR